MNEIVERALQVGEIIAKTVISTIPVGGALMTAIYDTVKGNGLAKRQKKWQDELESSVSKINATLNDIANSETFTTAIIKATEIAMKTSNEEKLKYLANAVVNSYEENTDETHFYLYMGWIEKYTARHIEIIKKYPVLTEETPELEEEPDATVFNQLVIDGLYLYSNGATGRYSLSPIANSFLAFLTEKQKA